MKTVYVSLIADLLHAGHIKILREASKHGEVTVGLLTSTAITELGDIAYLKYQQRLDVLEDLKMVSNVISQDTASYKKNLLNLKPDFVVHGNDWIKGPQSKYREEVLTLLGFECYRMPSGDIDGVGKDALVNNLYAKIGEGKTLCFAGHTDVVPAGNKEKWSISPFEAEILNGNLVGRGVADMKGSIAAFIAAFARYINDYNKSFCVSFLLTGDEEGHAKHGTKTMLPKLQDMGEKIDHCIVGEPTNPNKLGEMIKIGRRGSLHGVLKVYGKEGHVAYPHKAANPLPLMSKFISALSEVELDKGNDHFQPSLSLIHI